MRPASTVLAVAPWLCWATASAVLAMEPLVGSALYTLAALWLCLSLCLQTAPKAQRLLLLALAPLPAIVIFLRRLPALADVGVILAPFYVVPAVTASLAALAGAFFVGLHRGPK